MKKHQFRDAVIGDIPFLAANLRQADIDDIRAVGWDDPTAALTASFNTSVECWVALDDDGNAAVMFGVADSGEPGVGFPWLLATSFMDEFPIETVRQSYRYLKRMHARFPVLTQIVDFRNHVSASWMLWLGFEATNVILRYGPERRPFINFRREQKPCP